MKKPLVTITFDIEAGKFEPDGSKNCKYCNTVTDANEAVRLFEFVNDYPYAELDIVVTVDGLTSRINLLGGISPREQWLPREHVKRAFDSDAITWTRAFDMLMSECGMPMEKALQCLAEHFDRRPAIQAKEPSNG